MGCKMNAEAITLENMGFELSNDAVVDWMRTHTMSDIKDLVFELYSLGEEVSELVAIVNELEDMEMEIYGEDMFSESMINSEMEMALA